MVSLVLWLSCLHSWTQDSQEDEVDSERIVWSMEFAEESIYVEESIVLLFKIRIDREFREQAMIDLFRRPLGLPLQIQAPFLDQIEGWERTGPEPYEASFGTESNRAIGFSKTLALNGVVVAADSLRDLESGLLEAEIRIPFKVQKAGIIEIPPATLRYAYATAFEDDFINGRVPLDRVDESLPSNRTTLTVLSLPTSAPSSFAGGVGKFSIDVSRIETDQEGTESLSFLFRVRGQGNLDRITPPKLQGLEGIHVLGTIANRGESEVSWRVDVVPRKENLQEIPSLDWSYFDPDLADYVTLRTEALPIRVDPAQVPEPLIPEEEVVWLIAGDNDIFDIRPAEKTWQPGRREIVLGLISPWGGALAWVMGRRLRRWWSETRGARTARIAAWRFRFRVRWQKRSCMDSFAQFLAEHLGCLPAAVVCPQLDAKLVKARVPESVAKEAASTMERLVAERFGDEVQRQDPRNVERLVLTLQKSFRRGI